MNECANETEKEFQRWGSHQKKLDALAPTMAAFLRANSERFCNEKGVRRFREYPGFGLPLAIPVSLPADLNEAKVICRFQYPNFPLNDEFAETGLVKMFQLDKSKYL